MSLAPWGVVERSKPDHATGPALGQALNPSPTGLLRTGTVKVSIESQG